MQKFGSMVHALLTDILLGRNACHLRHLAVELCTAVACGMGKIVNHEVGIRKIGFNLGIHNLPEVTVALTG